MWTIPDTTRGALKKRLSDVVMNFIIWLFIAEGSVQLLSFVNFYYYLGFYKYYKLASLIALIAIVVLAYVAYRHTLRIWRSQRYDLMVSYAAVIFIIGYWHYHRILKGLTINPSHYILRVSHGNLHDIFLPLLVALLLIIFAVILPRLFASKREYVSPLLEDRPKAAEDPDYLSYSDDAKDFADVVASPPSEEGFVFGIDAPWGSGKTSYINLFVDQLRKNYLDSTIIFRFEPFVFSKNTDLTQKFIRGLRDLINSELYAPELSRSILSYGRLVTNVQVKVFGLETTLFANKSLDDELSSLKDNLRLLDKRVIITIDDLDRLPYENILEILSIVKKSFDLPNLTFILCYDSENIRIIDADLRNTHVKLISQPLKRSQTSETQSQLVTGSLREELERQKLYEYLEKIINVKKSLLPAREKLESYFIKQIEDTQAKLAEEANPKLTRHLINEVHQLFSADSFGQFAPFIGDIRKIKRVLNILVVQNLLTFDYSSSDVNFSELLKLILIYIDYPKIFRDIYTYETGGSYGYFSLRIDFSLSSTRSNGNKFENSQWYQNYSVNLPENPKFLLDSLFKKFWIEGNMPDEMTLSTSAAINGQPLTGYESNLERYLQLITGEIKERRLGSNRKAADDFATIVKNGGDIEQLFSEDYYLPVNGDKPRKLVLNRIAEDYELLSGIVSKKNHGLLTYTPE